MLVTPPKRGTSSTVKPRGDPCAQKRKKLGEHEESSSEPRALLRCRRPHLELCCCCCDLSCRCACSSNLAGTHSARPTPMQLLVRAVNMRSACARQALDSLRRTSCASAQALSCRAALTLTGLDDWPDLQTAKTAQILRTRSASHETFYIKLREQPGITYGLAGLPRY